MGKSKKLMSKNDIKKYVKEKGEDELLKDDLIEIYIGMYGEKPHRSANKSDIWKDICKKADFYQIYEKYKEDHFGMSIFDIEERFNIDKYQRKKLQKKGILEVAYTRIIKSSARYEMEIPYYSLDCLYKLDKEEFYKLAEANKKKEPTQKQLESLAKARESRKCKACGYMVKKKSNLIDGLCSDCYELIDARERIKKEVKEIFDNKEKYVILDTETTGLGPNDEIIEIAIIDLDGNVLIDTRVDTDVPINYGAYEVHGITKEDLKGKPKFKDINEKVSQILEDKTALIFNDSFDIEKLKTSGYTGKIKSICMMGLYMNYVSSSYFISLQNAMLNEGLDIIQDHSALGDCYCVLKLLETINLSSD